MGNKKTVLRYHLDFSYESIYSTDFMYAIANSEFFRPGEQC